MISPQPDESDGRPSWDQDEADWLIGKHVVVGITRLASDGRTAKAQSQYRGKIISADEVNGFKIECEGSFAGKIMTFPADLRAFRYVDGGELKRPISEVVENPDIISNWTIVEPSNPDADDNR
jgi:hypothetical protein